MIGDLIGAVVLFALAFWFARYTTGNPILWAWEQVKAGWERIGE